MLIPQEDTDIAFHCCPINLSQRKNKKTIEEKMLEIPFSIFFSNLEKMLSLWETLLELQPLQIRPISCIKHWQLPSKFYLISAILLPPLPITHPMISLGTVISWVWWVLWPLPLPPARAANAANIIFSIISEWEEKMTDLRDSVRLVQIQLIHSIRWCGLNHQQRGCEVAFHPSPSETRNYHKKK